jgi:hypothetical protein
MKPIYIVWNPNGPHQPQQTHSEQSEAVRVCKAMAMKYPGQTFYVMESLVGYVKSELQEIKFGDQEIPF